MPFDFGLISGPIIGGLFGVVNAYFANKQRKNDQAHEAEMARQHRETTKTEAECAIAKTREEYSGKAFAISQQVGNMTALSSGNLGLLLKGNIFMKSAGTVIAILLGLTDVIRQMIRPGITVWLGVVTSNWVSDFMGELGGLSIEKRMFVIDQSVSSYLQLFMVCVSWWFGDRMTNKLLDKGKS